MTGSTSLLPITTERLLLRPYTHADLDASLAYYGDPQVARHLIEPPWTPAIARERIAERVDQHFDLVRSQRDVDGRGH